MQKKVPQNTEISCDLFFVIVSLGDCELRFSMLSPSQRTIVHAIFPTFQTSTCQSSQILEISMAKIVHFTRKPTELKSMNSDEALISWCPDRPSRMSRSCSLSSQVHAMRYALIPFLSVSLRYSIIDGQY